MPAEDNLVTLSAKQERSKRFSELFIDEDEVSPADTPSKPGRNTNPCSVDAVGVHTKSQRSVMTDKSINSDQRAGKSSTIRECHNLSLGEDEDHGLTSAAENSHIVCDAPASLSAPRLPSSSARKKGTYTNGTTSSESKARLSVPTSETKVKSSAKRSSTHSASKQPTSKPKSSHTSATQERECPPTTTTRSSKTHSSRRREEPAPEVVAVQAQLCMEDLEPESPICEKDADHHEMALLEEEDVCCICLETYETDNPKFTAPCTHHFHLACLLDWKQRNNTCPMCCAETLRGVGGEEVVPPPPTNRPDCTMDEIFARRLQVHYLTQPQRGRGPPPRGGQNYRYAPNPGAAPAASTNGRPRGGPQQPAQRQLGSAPQQQQQQQQSGSRGRNSRVRQSHRSDAADKKSCAVM